MPAFERSQAFGYDLANRQHELEVCFFPLDNSKIRVGSIVTENPHVVQNSHHEAGNYINTSIPALSSLQQICDNS